MSAAPQIPFSDAVRVWARVAAMSFGGPAGQIAVMHRELVEERGWISERRFLHALNFCMLLPGPEAQQLATYIGWLMHGVRGGIVAGGLFILPGVVAILLLSLLYAAFGEVPAVEALFFGLKAAVLAIVIDAVIRIGRRALRGALTRLVAMAAFVSIFLFAVPFPLIVFAAALVGFVASRSSATTFRIADDDVSSEQDTSTPHRRRSLLAAATFALLWLLPVLALLLTLGRSSVFTDIALFFSRMAVVTFGGAYAVLAYVAQEAVEQYQWVTPQQMLDGLGMAETTPGPLIMVTQFVGFMGAFRDPGALHPLLAGTLGGLLTTWVTFMPCFFWIFLGGPYIERLRGNRALAQALSAITAAVVGVILNLALWFAIHFLFGIVIEVRAGPLHFDAPVATSIQTEAAVLTIAAAIAILWFRLGAIPVLIGCAVAGTAIRLVQ